MRGINKVILVGNATRAAELRCTQSGKAVVNLRLATNRVANGQEAAQFHTVVCWDRLAETVAEYVKTGDPLYVEGRLQYRSFQDEEGRERGVAEVVASDVQFLGSRRVDPPPAEHLPTTATPEDASPDEPPF